MIISGNLKLDSSLELQNDLFRWSMRAEPSVDRLGSGIHNLEYNERNASGVDRAR